jgi:putative ABC transport system ATP-binding protein
MRAEDAAGPAVPASSNRHRMVIRDLRSTIKGPFNADFCGGECTMLQGPSGAGKSLFLRMVADLDPNTGTVLLDGVERTTIPAPQWRARVTYVAAEPGFWADSVGEHMADRPAARRLLPDVGLDPALLDAPVARLSTGERQRVGLIRAIVGGPRFLLLDEPTSALDEAARTRVETMLSRLKVDGVGLIIVSHDPAQARRLGDRQLRLGSTGLEQLS